MIRFVGTIEEALALYEMMNESKEFEMTEEEMERVIREEWDFEETIE